MTAVSYGVRCSFQRNPQQKISPDGGLRRCDKQPYGYLLFRLLLLASRLLRLWLKQRSIFAVAFFLQFFRRNKAEGSGVYAEPLTSRSRAVVEQMAEMRITRFPANLNALHCIRGIPLFRYVLRLNGFGEAGPTRTAVELIQR